jgi:hypothetical protein
MEVVFDGWNQRYTCFISIPPTTKMLLLTLVSPKEKFFFKYFRVGVACHICDRQEKHCIPRYDSWRLCNCAERLQSWMHIVAPLTELPIHNSLVGKLGRHVLMSDPQ